MKQQPNFCLLIVSLLILIGSVNVYASSEPNVFLLNSRKLAYSKALFKKGDSKCVRAVQDLVEEANQALSVAPVSVVTKKMNPPSGDKHDYMSMGPYWWPNPNTPNGLPYIRKDGQRNPERKLFEDRENLGKLIESVRALSLAYYFTDELQYAQKAAVLLKVWFLDPKTKMNPNLNFGQSVPGVTDGRAEGLIETSGLTAVVDGIQLIASSGVLSDDELVQIKHWFSDFLNWINTSPVGNDEIKASNNHGVWCDVQSMSYALFTNQLEWAKQMIQKRTMARMESQIMPDGKMPRELARTLSWDYSNMNLKAFYSIARLAENVQIDLYQVKKEQKPLLESALDYLAGFLSQPEKWEHQQIKKMEFGNTIYNLRMGTLHYSKTSEYEKWINMLGNEKEIRQLNLLYPVTPEK